MSPGLSGLGFTIDASDGLARCGRFHTPHGEVRTPVFMPVGTQGTVKGVQARDLRELGVSILLGNTYHLHLRPGEEVVRELGGLHRFMDWSGPILTDSGGFQVMSLKSLRKIRPQGVEFRSHLDGSRHFLSPERAMAIQEALGSDIAMPLDVCPTAAAGSDEVRAAVELSLAWLGRAKAARRSPASQALFGIVQGGTDLALRRRSAEESVALDLDGYSIGGLAVGEDKARTFDTVAATAAVLPRDRPRYLMGMGTPGDLVEAVGFGVDMFDSVLPTRCARNALAFTSEGRLNLKNARFKTDPGPLDPACRCTACTRLSRAYLRHLFVAREMLGGMLLTLHNLTFYLDTIERLRQAISAQRFESLRRELRSGPGAAGGGPTGSGTEA